MRWLLLLAVGTPVLFAQGVEYVRANYTKYEYQVPMRDGVKLFTAVYVPKDQSKQYPVLMTRTPYSVAPYGVDHYRAALGPNERFAKAGYIFVYQDVRGRYQSEGTFVEMTPHLTSKKSPKDIDESSDTYDTIEWLLKRVPGHNGRVGITGISYPGFYAAAGMIDAHPALKAASPQAPIGDLFMGDDAYHNGAFMLAANFGFYASFGKSERTGPSKPGDELPLLKIPTEDSYDFYLTRLGPLANADEKYLKYQSSWWTDLVRHPTYDAFWQARDITRHVKNIQPAVLLVGGYFDAEDPVGALTMYRNLRQSAAAAPATLVYGPWVHGGWARGDGDKLGNVSFSFKTADWYRDNVEFPWFEHHLRGAADPKLPAAVMFETGTNVWRKFDAWPPPGAQLRTLTFQPAGKLSWTAATQQGFDEYPSDPAHPVPFTSFVAEGMAREYMTDDQRFASRRPDVVTYATEPLTEDVTIAGPVTPSLTVATSGTDADFVVKLIDVYPDDYPTPKEGTVKMGGYQQLVRGEPFRGRYRKSFERPEAFLPNQPEKIEFAMPDIFHTFRRGHRIMVQVQSSWFPLTDRNPQQFVNIPTAKESDFRKATNRVYFGSGVKVLVVP